MLAWEQERVDAAVADVFGFHALQLGLPELDGLRDNRMPHRWVARDELLGTDSGWSSPGQPMGRQRALMPGGLAGQSSGDTSDEVPRRRSLAISLHCEYDALPFPNASIDLVVLPHTLELARDPHQTLHEVERVLVPEGRLVISGFNPASLWGLRQRAGRLRRGLGLGADRGLYLPSSGDFIGYWRLRDWLRLLSFEVESGQFGCWRPPFKTESWLQRFAWMDRVGDRWWPVLGSLYFLVATKRVRGMRLVGLQRSDLRRAHAAPAAVANRQHQSTELEHG